MFSTQLLTLNYPVILSHRRSTTVSLDTYPLFSLENVFFARGSRLDKEIFKFRIWMKPWLNWCFKYVSWTWTLSFMMTNESFITRVKQTADWLQKDSQRLNTSPKSFCPCSTKEQQQPSQLINEVNETMARSLRNVFLVGGSSLNKEIFMWMKPWVN